MKLLVVLLSLLAWADALQINVKVRTLDHPSLAEELLEEIQVLSSSHLDLILVLLVALAVWIAWLCNQALRWILVKKTEA
eukprot:s4964_g1.t1